MCGFVSDLNHNQVPVNMEMLRNMTAIQSYRDPDDKGFFIDGHVGLGFRRLIIIDLKSGAQPLTNEHKDI